MGNKQLKSGAVTTLKVRDKSLRLKDFKTGQVPSGAQGPAGPQGPTGATGPKGTDGTAGTAGATNVVARFSTESKPVGDDEAVTVSCLAGEKAVGGGGNIPPSDPEVTIVASNPSPATDGSTPTGWTMHFKITGIAHNVTASVVCAKP